MIIVEVRIKCGVEESQDVTPTPRARDRVVKLADHRNATNRADAIESSDKATDPELRFCINDSGKIPLTQRVYCISARGSSGDRKAHVCRQSSGVTRSVLYVSCLVVYEIEHDVLGKSEIKFRERVAECFFYHSCWLLSFAYVILQRNQEYTESLRKVPQPYHSNDSQCNLQTSRELMLWDQSAHSVRRLVASILHFC